MKLGMIYAGQGSQALGMGRDLYEQSTTYAQVLESVDPTGEYRALMFGENLELLSQTKNTQPCMVAMAVALTAVLKEKGIAPSFTAGLSLGEYSALACSGVLEPNTAVDLVAFRGKVMTEAAAGKDCCMYAVLQLSQEALEEACAKARALGVVEIANYNCPNQLVMGGERLAVEEAVKLATEAGARRCMPLAVSGPFHTSLMKPAGDALGEKFQSVHFGEMEIPVVFNATGKPLQAGESIPQLLEAQVQSAVYFEQSLRYMIAQGVDTFVEIGPGKVLSGFLKKIDGTVPCYGIDSVESLELALEKLC